MIHITVFNTIVILMLLSIEHELSIITRDNHTRENWQHVLLDEFEIVNTIDYYSDGIHLNIEKKNAIVKFYRCTKDMESR